MGNSHQNLQTSSFIDESLNDFDKQTYFVEEINDQIFGKIRIHKRKHMTNQKSSNFIMEKQTQSFEKVEYAQLYYEAGVRLNLSHKYFLQFLGYHFIGSDDIFASHFKANLYFEYHYHNLSLEIKNRNKNLDYFLENDLWYLLISLISVCGFLQQNQIYHGDIRPRTILLTQKGVPKIGDNGLINPNKTGYLKTLNRIENTFISPQQMEFLKRAISNPQCNSYKQDVFSLGLTILQSALLKDIGDIYDWVNLTMSEYQLQLHLRRLEEGYSQEFCIIVRQMLCWDDESRPDFLQLLNNQLLQGFGNQSRINLQLQNTSRVLQSQQLPQMSQLLPVNVQQNVQSAVIGQNQSRVIQNSNVFALQNRQQPFQQSQVIQQYQPESQQQQLTQTLQQQSQKLSNTFNRNQYDQKENFEQQQSMVMPQQQPVVQNQQIYNNLPNQVLVERQQQQLNQQQLLMSRLQNTNYQNQLQQQPIQQQQYNNQNNYQENRNQRGNQNQQYQLNESQQPIVISKSQQQGNNPFQDRYIQEQVNFGYQQQQNIEQQNQFQQYHQQLIQQQPIQNNYMNCSGIIFKTQQLNKPPTITVHNPPTGINSKIPPLQILRQASQGSLHQKPPIKIVRKPIVVPQSNIQVSPIKGIQFLNQQHVQQFVDNQYDYVPQQNIHMVSNMPENTYVDNQFEQQQSQNRFDEYKANFKQNSHPEQNNLYNRFKNDSNIDDLDKQINEAILMTQQTLKKNEQITQIVKE